MNGITCHAVAGSDIQVQYTDPITYPTGGDWFDINGNFLDILLQISEFGGSNKYLLAYNSPNTGSGSRNIGIEVHYAGMGGFSNIEYTAPEVVLKKATSLKVVCYPNPFNPSITIDLEVPESFTASAEIFNIRGQLIRQLNTGHTGSRSLRWDAKDLKGRDIAAGVYLLQVNLLDESGTHHSSELIKIIHAR